MLSALKIKRINDAPTVPMIDKTWERNIQDDLKEAIDLLFNFKASLEKLHPECTRVIERIMQPVR